MNSALLGSFGALALSTLTAVAADVPAATAPSAPCKTAITFPAYGGIVAQNPNPACITVPGVGDVYVGGAITGYGFLQSNAFPPLDDKPAERPLGPRRLLEPAGLRTEA
ncbi:hypothetical protein [Lichenibacterium minor]|uniref:hypothetical protein n=1 Tax=Lichenibacterium minor TaxID=2316528 RepID=UPI0026CAE0A6